MASSKCTARCRPLSLLRTTMLLGFVLVPATVAIADPRHPITQGLAPWTMVDEVYKMQEPGPGSHVLLTTDHPDSLHALAWTRTVGQARVFVLASGHGAETYANPSFREVLRRGILWAAGRL